ncbi:MAG: hypothetical protein WC508_01740 [Patescibacteria group bacterium]
MKKHTGLSIAVTVVVVTCLAFIFCGQKEEKMIKAFWPKKAETSRFLFVPEAGTFKETTRGQFLLVNPFIRGDQVVAALEGRFFSISDLVTDVRASDGWKSAIMQVTAKTSLFEAVAQAAASEKSPEITNQIIKEIRKSGSLVKGDSRASLKRFTLLSKP